MQFADKASGQLYDIFKKFDSGKLDAEGFIKQVEGVGYYHLLIHIYRPWESQLLQNLWVISELRNILAFSTQKLLRLVFSR